MLGLDVWNGSRAAVEGFGRSREPNITFPLLLNASGSAPAAHDHLVVVAPNGTVAFSRSGLSSSISAAEAKVKELLAQIPSPAPAISVPLTAVNFDPIVAGQTGEQTITITNTGTADLEITDIKGEGDVAGLTFDTVMFTVEPGGSRTVTVTFPSSTAGTFSGNITISSNDPDRATQTLSVSVIVQPPPVPAISVQQSAVDFGTIDAGQTGEQTITIENTGTALLEITGIEGEGDVSGLTFDDTMFTVEPGDSRSVTVTFPSSTAGTFSGNITISSNDPNSGTSTLSVSVIVQPPPVPAISVQQTAVDFGTIDAGQTGEQTITIENTGTALLEITGIEGEGDVSGLTFDDTMFTVEPGDSRSVTVTFPSSTAARFRVISLFRAMIRIVEQAHYPCL